MKQLLVLLSCALLLSVVVTSADAASGIRLWPRHKTPKESTEAPKPKTKRSVLHRAKPSRDESARSEASYGMPGPKSVGWRHPTPGPAGYGAK